MRARISLLASTALLIIASPSHAQEDALWKQNFVGCAASASPYMNENLFPADKSVRPLMRIGDMQAWAVKGEDGNRELALTTDDGLTIYGRIVGPQGEDISGALLATAPSHNPEDRTASTDRQLEQPAVANLQPSQPIEVAPGKPAVPEPSPQASISTDSGVSPAAKPAEPTEPDETSPSADSVPPAASETQSEQPDQQPPQKLAAVGSQTVADVPEAANLDELLTQARDTSMWFTAGSPKEDAPTIYMFADPTCPHCGWSIDALKSQIADGSIDLRIILAPIRSAEAFNISGSILHSDNVAQAFVDQALTHVGAGKSAPTINPETFDPAVVKALQRNVMWMRKNGVKGVPFYLYKTKEGAQFAFGSLPESVLNTALAE